MTAPHSTPPDAGAMAALGPSRPAYAVALASHVRQHRLAYMTLLVIWTLAYIRVFVDPIPRLPVLFNVSQSLPYRVAVIRYGDLSVQRGDFVVFSFSGTAQRDYPGLKGQPFFKVVRGVPGDRITVRDRDVFVNGVHVGCAKAHTFDRKPLEPIASMVIPDGHYYVQGTDANSFDSRYRSSGLVPGDRVIGKVIPLL